MTHRARTGPTWGAHLPTARDVNSGSRGLCGGRTGDPCQRAPVGFFDTLKLVALLAILGGLVTLQFLQLAAPIEVAASISVVVVLLAIAYHVSKMKQALEARRARNTEASVRTPPNAPATQEVNW